jgi:glucose-1-phosphate thymidylyltransferase
VLAAGRGTRMQRGLDDASLSSEQRAAAALGLKSLIPFDGHPFLSWVLTTLADAGITHVCLVTGGAEHPVQRYYTGLETSRISIHFAAQTEPRGSAHALLAAEPVVAGRDFILINADNDYPVPALDALRRLGGPGLIGFRATGLLRANVTAERLSAYALLDVSPDGMLRRIHEKPAAHEFTADALISMTCWRFDSRIFDACRDVAQSQRGEYELPDAVNDAIRRLDVQFQVVPMDAPVLDLSRPEDVAAIGTLLRGRRVDL